MSKDLHKRKYVRHTIEDLRAHAAAKGGKCLSGTYLGHDAKHDWECARGHRWSARWGHVKRGGWCPECAREAFLKMNDKYAIEDLRAHAAAKGGKCLSETYKGIEAEYDWECADGHRWTATWHHVNSHGTWCPVCSRNTGKAYVRDTITDLRGHALERGGVCHSDEYKGVMGFYEWECSHGHRWAAQWHSVKGGCWCPVCAIEALFGPDNKPRKYQETIKDLQDMARAREGRCLSRVYRGTKAAYRWQCSCGHVWDMPWDRVRAGIWCSHCRDKRRDNLADLQLHAYRRNGKCHATKYEGTSAKYVWECHVGHKWEARWNNVKNNGSWCPYCAKNGLPRSGVH